MAQSVRSLRLESESNEILLRVERMTEDHARIITETREHLTTLSVQQTALSQQVVTAISELKALGTQFNESRRPNYTLLIVLIPLIPICLGGLAFSMQYYITASLEPVKTQMAQIVSDSQQNKASIERMLTAGTQRDSDIGKMSQLSSMNATTLGTIGQTLQRVSEMALSSAQADVSSKTDRIQLNDRMSKVEHEVGEEIAQRRSGEASVSVHLGEIEQQFHAVSNITNKDRAEQMRINALVWERAYGSRWPAETFFPTSIFQGTGGAPIIGK